MEVPTSQHQSLLTEETDNEKGDIIFELFAKCGSKGKYQYITLIFWCLSLYLCGGITLIIPYLFYEDPYVCPQTFPDRTCTQYVCSLPSADRQPYIPIPIMSTMANQFGDYRCSSDSTVLDAVILMIYSSTVVSYFLLAVLGDYLGRKKFLIFGLVLTILGLVIALLSPNLIMGASGTFISCLGSQWIYFLAMMFISETVSESLREQFYVIAQTFYGIGHLVNSGYYYWLLDWKLVFFYFYIIPSVLTLIGVILFVIDSPICLIRRLCPSQVLKQFTWVARVNGIDGPEIALQQIEKAKQIDRVRQKQQESGSKFGVLDLFRYKSLRFRTIGLAVLQSSIIFLFYAPTLMIAQFQFDIFLNGLVIGGASIFSYPFCYFAINRMRRRTMGVISFVIVFICSFVLIYFWEPKDSQSSLSVSENIGILVAFFVIAFVITVEYIFYEVYMLELYPTQVRLIGGSFATVIAGITISFEQFIIDGCNKSGFSIMIVFSIFSIISILTSIKLPETFEKTTPDFIEELAVKSNQTFEKKLSHEQGVKNSSQEQKSSSILMKKD